MDELNNFIRFIDRLQAANCNFALWSVQGSNTPEIIITGNNELIYPANINKLNGQNGFVFAPYEISEKSPLILLRPGIYKKGIEEITSINYENIQKHESGKHKSDEPCYFISRDEYLANIRQTVDEIKSTKLDKVIVSRLIPFKRNNESIGEVYMQLFKQIPNAFVYLINLPKAGFWMGATPEILLKSEGKMFETVSLAGTQSRHNNCCYEWRTKEIEEQAFVSRYILDIFHKFNIHSYTASGPETLESGKVAHLSTSFRFPANKLGSNFGDFIAKLHPTPAVCGYPKSKAAQFISKIEKHNRRYYTGYLGPWNLNGNVELFVNLRCMEIRPEQYILYSGGGITSCSIPEYEWEETNNKAENLLSAIKTVQNK
ncbi:MAG: chorismate-binding protein [Bacteroidales bacterium]|jgi:isochorismate synthase|nr:chorismate-binding protein [Bacteroidales bacterium]